MTCLSRYLTQIWIFWSRNFQSSSVIHHLYFNNKEVGNKSEKKNSENFPKKNSEIFFLLFIVSKSWICEEFMKLMPEKIMNLQGSWIVKSWNAMTPCIMWVRSSNLGKKSLSLNLCSKANFLFTTLFFEVFAPTCS